MPAIAVQKLHTFTGHHDSIYALQKATQPTSFYTAGSDGFVVLWDSLTPEQNGKLVAKVPNTVYALCNNGNHLVIGQNFEGIHIIDTLTLKEIGSLKISNSQIFAIVYHNKHLWVASGNGLVSVIDYQTLTFVQKYQRTDKSARCMAVNPITDEIAIGYSDNYIRIFDANTFELKTEWQAHSNSVFSLAYSLNGRFLLSGSRDAHLKIWETSQNYRNFMEIIAHLYTVNDIAFTPSGKYFATCSKDKSIKVWESATFKLLKVIDKARHAGHGTSVNKLFWIDDNKLISASDDRTATLWQISFE
jgi:WD40 repeat protein